MTDLVIERCMQEAEGMFSRLPNITVEHENYEFLVAEISKELDNADKLLRNSMMSITSEEKGKFEARIQRIRIGLLKPTQDIKDHRMFKAEKARRYTR